MTRFDSNLGLVQARGVVMKGAVLYNAKVYHIFGNSKHNIYEDASTKAHQLDSTQL